VYQALLTRRYLSGKIMPLLSALAVVLCTAMVLVTWSVMGGFLQMLLESGKRLMGDVAITFPNTGFPYYEDLIQRLEADPMVEAAAPVLETYGLLTLPPGNNTETVVVKGIDGPSFDRVTGFNTSLWWKPLDKPVSQDTKREDPRVQTDYKAGLERLYRSGQHLEWKDPDNPAATTQPAIVTGIEVNRYNHREPGGWIRPAPYAFLPGKSVTLSIAATDKNARLVSQETRTFPVANELRTGLYEADANNVYMPLATLQAMRKMDAAKRAQPQTNRFEPVLDPKTNLMVFPEPEIIGVDPARVTSVIVKAKPISGLDDGQAAARLKERALAIYADFAQAHEGDPVKPIPADYIQVMTWRERQRSFIGAVEKEIALVLFLFSFISLTAVFLVLAIFWSMISEKTKDIGVLRALGASKTGVAGLWLGYGLAIGLVGSSVGMVVAYFVVKNINPIHEWMGRALGITIWNPEVYYFTQIPSKIDWNHALIVFIGGALSSVVGALIPALRAANMDPVRALRFE
jgi:lipoprotein-releasing system permease protein